MNYAMPPGMGTLVAEAPSSAEALIYAGLDWQVEQKDVYTEDGSLISGYKVNTRSSDNAAELLSQYDTACEQLTADTEQKQEAENLKNQPLTLQFFDVVKSPSGGATVFSVPCLSGDEAEKELTGIILDYTTPRAYWDTHDPVEGTPPS
jgi:hypothetical protein